MRVERTSTADGIRLTVAAEDERRANRAIADAMDSIAGAADAPVVAIERGRERRAEREAAERPLVFERLRGLAPLVVLIVALMVAVYIPGQIVRVTAFVAVLIGVGMLVSERGGGGDDDRTYGGGRR